MCLLGRRRLGSVEEGFIKQLQIGDLFVLGGRVVRLIDTGVQEAFVERADGHLPTVPRWNAAKMPLTSGLARAVRQLRPNWTRELRGQTTDANAIDWLVENYRDLPRERAGHRRVLSRATRHLRDSGRRRKF